MDVDVVEFLSQFSAEDLAERGILRGETRLLNNRSVPPLLKLMDEQKVLRLHSAKQSWHLTSNGEFANPLSDEAKSGNLDDLDNRGNLFNYQNVSINPHYGGGGGLGGGEGDEAGGAEDDGGSAGLKFGLERDFQKALRDNFLQLDPDLAIIDGGTEKKVEAGRIDITARDKDGTLVVIELKAGTAPLPAMGQILSYMGSVTDDPGQPVRGVLVANEFHDRLILAAKAVPNVSLVAYSIQFAFQRRWPEG